MKIAARVAWLAVGVGVSAGACANGGQTAMPPRVEAPVAAIVAGDAGVPDAAAEGVDAAVLATLDGLAARGPSVAAGMREVARGEMAGEASRVVARADDRDVCVRVTLVARNAVHAWLADTRGDVLADARDASEATLGTRGPVCVRKGDVVTLHLEASGPFAARFVAWESP